MKLFYICQNNSGGSFFGPALYVFIAAPSLKDAEALAEEYFHLCTTSERYGNFDECGCCPCCGHRWAMLYEADRDYAICYTEPLNMTNDGIPYIAFITNEGITIKNSAEDLPDLREKMLSVLNNNDNEHNS